MKTILVPVLLLVACNGAGPCIASCEADRDFWETCMDANGDLCGGTVSADCVDDVKAYQDCVNLKENDVMHYCEDAGDAVSSCKTLARERYRRMDAVEKEESNEECNTAPSSDWDLAFANADCDALCALF